MKTKLTEPREISFRVWDEERKGFLKEFNINIITNLNGTEKNPISSEYHIQQFTGLLDKTGRKIFEGDILKLDYGVSRGIGKVVYEMQGFYIEASNGALFGDTVSAMRHSEILGNIFENPNLLKS